MFRQLQNSTHIDQDAPSKVSIDKGQDATWEDDKTELISNVSGSTEMQVLSSYLYKSIIYDQTCSEKTCIIHVL